MWNRKSCCARDRPSHSDGDGKSRLQGISTASHLLPFCNLSQAQPVVACEEAQTVLVVKYYISGPRDWNSLSMTEEFVNFCWM
ncbi:unnamed protein product [Sphagnum troendelagicum]|uniref:Uncharacterized protein n=1 Tax=Sphagnum troendelagicum TaxID=128251 RepID=A0ABP0UN90_9BRYO